MRIDRIVYKPKVTYAKMEVSKEENMTAEDPETLSKKKEILYWKNQLETLRANFEKLLMNENQLYKEQLSELEKNHAEKLKLLDEKYKKRFQLIEKDAKNQIDVIKNEIPEKKKKIAALLQNTIQQQMDSLRKEFPESFNYLTKLNLRFINEFTVDNQKKFLLEVNENEHLLTKEQVKKDLNDSLTGSSSIKVNLHEHMLKYREKHFTVLSSISLQFMNMQKMIGIIKSIKKGYFEFQENGTDDTLMIPYEAINSGVVCVVES